MINRITSFSIKRTLKYSFILLIMTSVAAFTGCKGKKTDEHGHAAETHAEAGEKVDEHVEGDGHDHATETETQHSEGDGHDHSAEEVGAAHVEGDEKVSEHTDEIAFSKKQAELVGLTTETVSPATFYNAIKTSGQIQAPQGNEVVIAATSNGIVTFTNSSITEGTAVSAGQSIVTISAKKAVRG